MMTLEEARNLKHGEVLFHTVNKNADGTAQRWRVNGQVKVWKRDPSRVRIPVKHGLKRFDYISENELHLVSRQVGG